MCQSHEAFLIKDLSPQLSLVCGSSCCLSCTGDVWAGFRRTGRSWFGALVVLVQGWAQAEWCDFQLEVGSDADGCSVW